MNYAIISVYDKNGIYEFAKKLTKHKILATDGTFQVIKGLKNVIPLKKIFKSNYPDRVKTLHPSIFEGILYNRNEKPPDYPIDIVCVNLNPHQIDVGGAALLRAAAKNYKYVTVISSRQDYILDVYSITEEKRRELALKAFAYTSFYDAKISFPFLTQNFVVPVENLKALRYGENPHTYGYIGKLSDGLADADIISENKKLSYNNYLDMDAAYRTIEEFSNPACAIVKHTNPVAVSEASSALTAFLNAYSSDPVSSYGGIIGINTAVDEILAAEISKHFFECIIAPDFTKNAAQILKKIRAIKLRRGLKNTLNLRSITGGILIEVPSEVENEFEYPLGKPPQDIINELIFAWKVVKHLKSNAVVITANKTTLAAATGFPSRIEATKYACMKYSEKKVSGGVAASDGFFPFPDNIDVLASYGIKYFIAPKGSKRDYEIIDASKKHGMVPVFSIHRVFKH